MDLESRQPLKGEEVRSSDWPVQQAEPTGNAMFCRPWCICLPCGSVLVYLMSLFALVVFSFLSLVAGVLCCLPFACIFSWTTFWRWCPLNWRTDLYVKMIYISYYLQHRNVKQPAADAKHMPVSDLKPKGELKKFWVDFALNLQVPQGPEEQLPDRYLNPTSRENYIERHLTVLPMTEYSFYDSFGPDENPVDFVMKQMAAVYPEVYQEWPDKRSDEALTRFCLYGIGAQRVEVEMCNGKKHYVVRTNMLSGLPVMDAFERYGGDAYFDEQWRPVKIVDAGLSPPNAAWDSQAPVVTQPGDEGWERAKFRFRSSLFSLVTLVDHLYGIHLQTANLFVTALREQMSPEHPIRRFLTPFTYQTIAVNDNAAHNLTAPRSMGPRCFAFTERGLALAFAAAPNLLVNGQAVPEKEGGPFLNLKDYVAYLKGKGIDTEYWRQAMELHGIFETFLDEYLACHLPGGSLDGHRAHEVCESILHEAGRCDAGEFESQGGALHERRKGQSERRRCPRLLCEVDCYGDVDGDGGP
ncbi:unnamed protein product [Durusdinium trenchii]|uniref:Lipoxygenase domain-containing protein n=1 Tax=Durusdinium trenchii TaxID=1381693 RepID=A0ABP0NUU6_9DINO